MEEASSKKKNCLSIYLPSQCLNSMPFNSCQLLPNPCRVKGPYNSTTKALKKPATEHVNTAYTVVAMNSLTSLHVARIHEVDIPLIILFVGFIVVGILRAYLNFTKTQPYTINCLYLNKTVLGILPQNVGDLWFLSLIITSLSQKM